jgi:hypothetical protein
VILTAGIASDALLGRSRRRRADGFLARNVLERIDELVPAGTAAGELLV